MATTYRLWARTKLATIDGYKTIYHFRVGGLLPHNRPCIVRVRAKNYEEAVGKLEQEISRIGVRIRRPSTS